MSGSGFSGGSGARPRVIRHPSSIPTFPESRLPRLEPVLAEFEFRVTPYYAKLIDWSDPTDPLRKIVLPDRSELGSDLEFDPSAEVTNTRVRGLQHKYGPTALLLVTDVCAAYCRFCFRKRFTLATDPRGHAVGDSQGDVRRETTLDIRAAVEYIANHPKIDNVLLSGGDPLMLAPARLERILSAIRRIPHVRSIRIGSKVPAFDPDLVSQDLVSVLAAARSRDRRIYLAAHFSHVRELTGQALGAIDRLLSAGVIVYNQTPVLRGVNDDCEGLISLMQKLSDAGVPPYYLFQCRPVNGNERFAITLQEGLDLVDQVRPMLSGLAKRFRYVASHATGKIEILGYCDGKMIFRYHQARDPRDDGRVFTWPADRSISWLDEPVAALRPIQRPRQEHRRPVTIAPR